MPYSGGSYTLPITSWNPAVASTTISAADWNTTATDLSTALSTCLLKDGTQTATALIPFAQSIRVGTAGSILGFVDYAGNTSGTTRLQPAATASGTLTLPSATDTLVGRATTDTLTNKTITAAVAAGTWTASGTWTLPAFTLGGAVTATGQTITGGAFTGGTWNNGVIGGTTAAAVTGTLITATSGVTITGTSNALAVGGVGGFASGDTIAQFRAATNKNLAVRGNITLGSGMAIQAVNDAGTTQNLELFASGTTLGLNGGTVVFPSIGTTASAANAFLDSGSSNSLLRSTSSVRYKKDIQDVSQEAINHLLALRPITYRSKAPADDPAKQWYGLIAEEVAEVDPMLVQWSYPLVENPETQRIEPDTEADKIPDGVQYERVAVLLIGMMQDFNRRLTALEA